MSSCRESVATKQNRGRDSSWVRQSKFVETSERVSMYLKNTSRTDVTRNCTLIKRTAGRKEKDFVLTQLIPRKSNHAAPAAKSPPNHSLHYFLVPPLFSSLFSRAMLFCNRKISHQLTRPEHCWKTTWIILESYA